MEAHEKLERCLQMFLMLAGNRRYSIEEISEHFNISERTAYRYIESFKGSGFIFEDIVGLYRIDRKRGVGKTLSDLLHFSEEESYLLGRAIHSITDDNLLKSNLFKKLYSIYDFRRVADTVIQKSYSEQVHRLFDAIENKKQVVLKAYRSANSGKIADRLVEPFRFNLNYLSIWCYEPISGENKIFKTARIGEVEITDDSWQYEQAHHFEPLDVFRTWGDEQVTVTLELNLRSYNLLTEEFPMSEEFIKPVEDTKYLFEATLNGFHGVGRFVLGLPGEIKVIGPESFKKYLREKQKVKF